MLLVSGRLAFGNSRRRTVASTQMGRHFQRPPHLQHNNSFINSARKSGAAASASKVSPASRPTYPLPRSRKSFFPYRFRRLLRQWIEIRKGQSRGGGSSAAYRKSTTYLPVRPVLLITMRPAGPEKEIGQHGNRDVIARHPASQFLSSSVACRNVHRGNRTVGIISDPRKSDPRTISS